MDAADVTDWFTYAQANLAGCDYKALPDPARTIHVSPLEVDRLCRLHLTTKAERGEKLYDFGRIVDGDWSSGWAGKPNPVLADMPAHRSVFMRFIRGTPWEDTPVFASQLARIETDGVGDHGMQSRDELVRRCRRLDDVWDDMRVNGYRVGPFIDAISVSVTEAGGLLLAVGGKHRLAMARLLRLPAIEVYVLARHAAWQEVRDRVCAGELSLPHPDLIDVS